MSASETKFPNLFSFSSTDLMSSTLRISMAFWSSFNAFCASPRLGAFSGWPRSTKRLLMLCKACSSPHLLPAALKNFSAFSADFVASPMAPALDVAKARYMSACNKHMLPWPMLSPNAAKMSEAWPANLSALWGWFNMACVPAIISKRSTSPRWLPEVLTAVNSLLAACKPAMGLSWRMFACTMISNDFTIPLVLCKSLKMLKASCAVFKPRLGLSIRS
mmetsp:Transcript_53199/g.106787  ORF Transcript_53199/g.106787 Transcript_53199/m.106787 type:complete len:219 (+) Transcript_53199:522-1178(+)